ncbi:MAG: hypothetical protein M5U09_05360, partial [Gammaproteobacteria bacterium]|nr:hypothetical protein [Gammaproteobacteria bacterium]
PLNRGDYDGYMPQWGGLDALRAHIAAIRERGVLPTFYMEGILACANTKVGSRYGPQYGDERAMDRWLPVPKESGRGTSRRTAATTCAPTRPGGRPTSPTLWRGSAAKPASTACGSMNTATAATSARTRSTSTCLPSPDTTAGCRAWPGPAGRCIWRWTRSAPGLVLTTEFPGNDHLAATLEGAITYETSSHVHRVRPAPLNLFRFYWPACKLYDLETSFRRQGTAWKLWNATGVFGGRGYPPAVHAVLEAHTEAFEAHAGAAGADARATGVCQPLHRPGVGGLHDSQRHRLHHRGGRDPVESATRQRVVDLVTGEPAPIVDGKLRARLARDETIVIGVLPE